MFVEDMSAFFSSAEFAVEAQLGGAEVLGVFDDAYIASNEVASTGPAFTLPTAHAVSVVEDETALTLVHPITGLSATYTVVEVQPDGTGVSVLRLRK